MERLVKIGTEIYDSGDKDNPPHGGTITDIISTEFSTSYQITTDGKDGPAESYQIPAHRLQLVYSETGLPQMVWRTLNISGLTKELKARRKA